MWQRPEHSASFRALRGLACLPTALLLGLIGCAGNAHLELAALDYRSIDPPAPKFAPINAENCYWWTDDSGHVWIAIADTVESLLFGKAGEFTFQMSLELKEAPAGRARDYLVEKRELRAVARVGPTQVRFVSVEGIVALYREPDDRLRGSFRLLTAREVSQFLGGWARGANVLMLGSFQAVRDERRGRAIVEATESGGWGRDAKPAASRPANE